MKSRALLICLSIILFLASSSFSIPLKNQDTNCPINFSVTQGNCQIIVMGSINCSDLGAATALNSFTGTITFTGPGGCWNGTITVARATQNQDGGWEVPSGYDVAVYLIGTTDACDAGDVEFIGGPSGAVNALNAIGPTFISEFQKDADC